MFFGENSLPTKKPSVRLQFSQPIVVFFLCKGMTSDAMYSGNSPNAHLIITIIIIFL